MCLPQKHIISDSSFRQPLSQVHLHAVGTLSAEAGDLVRNQIIRVAQSTSKEVLEAGEYGVLGDAGATFLFGSIWFP